MSGPRRNFGGHIDNEEAQEEEIGRVVSNLAWACGGVAKKPGGGAATTAIGAARCIAHWSEIASGGGILWWWWNYLLRTSQMGEKGS